MPRSRILDEVLDDGRIELTVRDPSGATRDAELDVRGREHELTEPAVLFRGLGFAAGPCRHRRFRRRRLAGERAGLEPGDLVIRGDDQPIEDWGQWVDFLRQRPGETVDVTVLRDGRELTVTATLETITENGGTRGRIGANGRDPMTEQRYGVVEVVAARCRENLEVIASAHRWSRT